ncbi:E3 ubiquitin-protein ligase RNF181 homolog [Seriola lalandi dorsalis]|nr:E3 ubiquitin-protein ligase RNF181 homolog [Seriola lalandi dorsalis]
MRTDRRASLPCQTTLSAMQLSRLHSSTRAPVTARVLLRRSSSRRLLSSPQEAAAPVTIPTGERRPSLIPTIPEATVHERRGQFRRRNVMSLSDADRVCLICHNDLNRGTGGTRELQCTHTFHKECIEEWLWRKQSCPTCHVQVSMPQPVHWSSARVKVP